jgi:hypothetical protein
LLVGSSVAAFAQSNALSAVQGNVTVTSGSTTSKAASDSVLKNGDVITASSGASATVKVGSCNVSLTPGQSLVVNTALPCNELMASVKTITITANAASGFPGGTLGLIGAGVGGVLVINELTKKDKASGS